VEHVAASEFDALVIPGGFAPDQLRRSDNRAAIDARDLPGGEAGGIHLPRGLGADLGQDSQG